MNSFDKVYRGILRALYEGRLLPGERLIAPNLARDFQASRNTVREVLNRLSATGVISMVRNQSPTVRVLSRKEMEDLLEIVGALLGVAVAAAARNKREGRADKALDQAYAEITASKIETDLHRFILAREHYYRALLQVGGNQELIRLFPTVHVHLMRVQLRSIPVVAQSAQFEDYTLINDAVTRGDADAAGKAAELHVEHMASAIRSLPDFMFQA